MKCGGQREKRKDDQTARERREKEKKERTKGEAEGKGGKAAG